MTFSAGFSPRLLGSYRVGCLEISSTATKTAGSRCGTKGNTARAWVDARDDSYNEYRQDSPSQIVVSSDDAERYIMQGWRFVGTLPNDRIVLETNLTSKKDSNPMKEQV